MVQDYLQSGKDHLKRKLKIFNGDMGNIYFPEEIEEMFKLIDTLNRTEFDSLNHIMCLTHNDGFESGYKNGVFDEKKKQERKKKKKE